MVKRAASDDFDSPWKDALQLYFQAFLAFFFPEIHRDVDWSRGYENLDKEFQRIVRRARVGKGLADKVFKVWLVSGEECWLLIHVEIQGSYEKDFSERMFRYNVAAYSVYNQHVVSLAVLCDENANWRPTSFAYGLWGAKTGIEFLSTKLLDRAEDLTALETDPNPFAAVALAHLQTLATQGDPQNRRLWKLRVTRGLFERGWPEEKIRQVFRVIDWIMDLPEEVEKDFRQEIERYEKEHHMPFMVPIERLFYKEGKEDGLAEGLWEAIEIALDLKFGKSGLRLMPKVRAIKTIATLRALKRTIRKAETLTEVRERLDVGQLEP